MSIIYRTPEWFVELLVVVVVTFLATKDLLGSVMYGTPRKGLFVNDNYPCASQPTFTSPLVDVVREGVADSL